MRLLFVSRERLSKSQNERVEELQKECFRHVSRKEIKECFFARGIGRILALERGAVVGQVEVFRRPVTFQGTRILLGGLGGTCVTRIARNRGIGHWLVKKGLDVLREQKCDIACLGANIREYPRGGLYYTCGFRLMNRNISFDDVYGRIRYDSGELFRPVCSGEIYDLVMSSKSTFHIGPGYW